MGYLHIENLYKNQEVLMFKELYALEKIHGTSAHVSFGEKGISYFSGGSTHSTFVQLFEEMLAERLKKMGVAKITIYGEAYGGKIQKMSNTYGKEMKFAAFDVKIDEFWLSVPQADAIVVNDLGLEFVHYVKIPADLKHIDAARAENSVQAIRNGVGEGKESEGIVLRPLIELQKNDGRRMIVKHKNDKFMETTTKREVSPEKLKILEDANAIAEEWVTEMRLTHVLDKLPEGINMESTGMVIKAMIEDVIREAEGEIVPDKDARKAIGKRAAELFKKRVQSSLYNEA